MTTHNNISSRSNDKKDSVMSSSDWCAWSVNVMHWVFRDASISFFNYFLRLSVFNLKSNVSCCNYTSVSPTKWPLMCWAGRKNHTKHRVFLFDDLSTIYHNRTFLYLTDLLRSFWYYWENVLQIPEAVVVRIILNIRVEWRNSNLQIKRRLVRCSWDQRCSNGVICYLTTRWVLLRVIECSF